MKQPTGAHRIALAAALLLPLNLLADTQIVTVFGELKSPTCDIRIDGGTSDSRVALPATTVAKLASTAMVDGTTPFVMTLSGCDTTNAVTPYFQNTQSTINAQGRLNNIAPTGAAQHVELQLLNSNASPINLSLDENSQNAAPATVPTGGTANFAFSIQYYATATASAGAVSSTLTYVLRYL